MLVASHSDHHNIPRPPDGRSAAPHPSSLWQKRNYRPALVNPRHCRRLGAHSGRRPAQLRFRPSISPASSQNDALTALALPTTTAPGTEDTPSSSPSKKIYSIWSIVFEPWRVSFTAHSEDILLKAAIYLSALRFSRATLSPFHCRGKHIVLVLM